jgi:hypothetical protein
MGTKDTDEALEEYSERMQPRSLSTDALGQQTHVKRHIAG